MSYRFNITDAMDIGIHEFSLATTDTLTLGGTTNVNLQVNFRINGFVFAGKSGKE